jgi:hypothetical protein
VESYFSRIGILLPGWHTGYWTALRTLNLSEPRSWSYRDPFVPTFSAETYSHWGEAQPDNAQAPEGCVAASWALRYQSGTPGLGAWGWDDQPCSNRLLVLCRIIRECRRGGLQQVCSSLQGPTCQCLAYRMVSGNMQATMVHCEACAAPLPDNALDPAAPSSTCSPKPLPCTQLRALPLEAALATSPQPRCPLRMAAPTSWCCAA